MAKRKAAHLKPTPAQHKSLRPTWEGHLRLSLVTCPVALFSATERTAEIHFNMINPKTNNRIKMITTDPETGPVEPVRGLGGRDRPWWEAMPPAGVWQDWYAGNRKFSCQPSLTIRNCWQNVPRRPRSCGFRASLTSCVRHF